MRETEYNGGRFGCFTAGDVKRSRSISLVPRPYPAFRHLQYGKAGEGLVSFLT